MRVLTEVGSIISISLNDQKFTLKWHAKVYKGLIVSRWVVNDCITFEIFLLFTCCCIQNTPPLIHCQSTLLAPALVQCSSEPAGSPTDHHSHLGKEDRCQAWWGSPVQSGWWPHCSGTWAGVVEHIVMDIGIVTHLSPLTSVYTLSNLPLCSFPLVILVYPTLIHYSYWLYLLLWFILPRVTHYYLYDIYFLNVSTSTSFFGKNQTWCCQTSLLGMPHDQHMFGAIPECPPLFSLILR